MIKLNTLFLCLLFLGISTYSQHVEASKDSVCFQDSVIHDNFAELDFNVADKEEYYKVSKLEKQYTKTLLFEERYHKLQRTEGIDRNYFLPIFSVNPGENLKITGKFVSNPENIDASTIKFMTTEGVVLTSKYDAATKAFTLTLSPSAVGNSQRYFAVAEHHISTSLNVPNKILVLGGFEVMTYSKNYQ